MQNQTLLQGTGRIASHVTSLSAHQAQPQLTPYVHHQAPALSRAGLLRTVLLSACSLPAAALLPSRSHAADSGLAADGLIDSLLATMQQAEPVTFPRRRLQLNFAVLLMRSGYEAVDDLDFVPMDGFQKDFWKLRAAEWQPYTVQYLPLRVPQGDLTDPNYFDFISFSQFAAISREIPQGRQVFKEYCEDCEGMTRLVTRDPSTQDNARLPELHARLTGERIYSGLVNGFRGVQYGGPQPCSPGCSFQELMAGVQQVLDIFTGQGFAINTTLSSVTPAASGRGGSFSVKMEGPANLWSLQSLASRRSLVYNAYDALAVAAYLRASGRTPTYKLAWTDTAITERWTVA